MCRTGVRQSVRRILIVLSRVGTGPSAVSFSTDLDRSRAGEVLGRRSEMWSDGSGARQMIRSDHGGGDMSAGGIAAQL